MEKPELLPLLSEIQKLPTVGDVIADITLCRNLFAPDDADDRRKQ
jgi:hypothetical protein